MDEAMGDFGKMMAIEEDSDVTVQVKEVEFRVHRHILSAQSPALSAMFTHETADKITVEDCEPEIFKEYLQYLYTGSVQSLTEQNVFDLYRIADKYLANSLKEQCLEFIGDTLSVQTFCNYAKLAFMHRGSDLLQKVIDFANENFQLIMYSVEWQNFLIEQTLEANEVLLMLLNALHNPSPPPIRETEEISYFSHYCR